LCKTHDWVHEICRSTDDTAQSDPTYTVDISPLSLPYKRKRHFVLLAQHRRDKPKPIKIRSYHGKIVPISDMLGFTHTIVMTCEAASSGHMVSQ